MGKVASETKFESEADIEIQRMKGDIKKSLQKEIEKVNVNFEELQISSIKDKDHRRKKFDDVDASYKEQKTKLHKYNELEKDSELDGALS